MSTPLHLSMFDYLAVSGTSEDRVIEYVDHLHDHFVTPVVIRGGHYTAPTAPGFSAALRPESVARYTFPGGSYWAAPDTHSDTQKGQAA